MYQIRHTIYVPDWVHNMLTKLSTQYLHPIKYTIYVLCRTNCMDKLLRGYTNI